MKKYTVVYVEYAQYDDDCDWTSWEHIEGIDLRNALLDAGIIGPKSTRYKSIKCVFEGHCVEIPHREYSIY
jgi:hypothetical protein